METPTQSHTLRSINRAQRSTERQAEQPSKRRTVFDSLIGGQWVNQNQLESTGGETSGSVDDPDMMDAINEALDRVDSTPIDDLVSEWTTPVSGIGKMAAGRVGKGVMTGGIAALSGAPPNISAQAGMLSAINPASLVASSVNKFLPGMVEKASAKRSLNAALPGSQSQRDEAISLFSDLENREDLTPAERAALVDRLHALGMPSYNTIDRIRNSAKIASRPYSQQITDWAGDFAKTTRDVVTNRKLADAVAATFDDEIGPPVEALLGPSAMSQTRPAADIGRSLVRGLMGVPQALSDIFNEMLAPKENPFEVFGMSLAQAMKSPMGVEYNELYGSRLDPMFGQGGYAAKEALGKTGASGSAADAVGNSGAGSAADAAGASDFGEANDGETGADW